MRISMRQRAGEHERYAPGCFDGEIGKQVPLTINGQAATRATLIAVEIADNGCEATLTFDVPDKGSATEFIKYGSPAEFSTSSFDTEVGRKYGPHLNVSAPPVEPTN